MEHNDRNDSVFRPKTAVIAMVVLATAALRFLPHPLNFTPVGAIALFGGAYFSDKLQALVIPLLALVVGDVFTGFHSLIPAIYASFLVSVAIGFWLGPRKSASRLGVAVLAGAVQFFLVTNFAVWVSGIGSYPKTISGLAACYAAGLPYFWNTLAGDAFYAGILFGGLALAVWRFPLLRRPASAG